MSSRPPRSTFVSSTRRAAAVLPVGSRSFTGEHAMGQRHGFRSAAVPLVKIVVGGAGAGVSTLIAAVSELPPLSTKVVAVTASSPAARSATTHPAVTELSAIRPATARPSMIVAELGRTGLSCEGLRYLVYLFGVAGAGWSGAVWDELCHASAGLLIVIDPWRLGGASAALDYATSCGLPYLIVIDCRDRLPPPAELRHALALPAYTPLLTCDLADRDEVGAVLTIATGYALSSASGEDHRV